MQREKEKKTEEIAENDEANWEQDQKKRSYYYDDSQGYEIYNPDEEDEDE